MSAEFQFPLQLLLHLIIMPIGRYIYVVLPIAVSVNVLSNVRSASMFDVDRTRDNLLRTSDVIKGMYLSNSRISNPFHTLYYYAKSLLISRLLIFTLQIILFDTTGYISPLNSSRKN